MGTTFTDSSVKVKIQVTNPNFSPIDVGVRYLWDWQIGEDDGPTFTQNYPTGSSLTNEIEFQPPEFVVYRIQDNDMNPSSPLFGIYGSATPPSGLGSDITPPGKLQFVCWQDSFGTAFNYTINPNRDIATTTSTCRGFAGGDTAVTYAFGPDATSALRVGSNGTLTIVAYLLAASPQDTDGDGLIDIWETSDTDLNGDGVIDVGPSVGSNPNRRDIYVEIDWMEDNNHSHKPNPEAIEKIVDVFDAHDINLHVDAGPNSIDYVTGNSWGQHSKGNAIPHDDMLGSANNFQDLSDDWDALVSANFGHSDRAYRHALFAHRASCYQCGKVLGVGIDQNLLVTLGTEKDGIGTLNEQAGTFMHELGHTLNLWHGGSIDQKDNEFNFKPNYLSVMNYMFTTGGLIINGVDGNFNYSEFQLPTLDEADLVETDGLNDARVSDYSTKYNISFPWLCWAHPEAIGSLGGLYVVSQDQPIDWNCNGEIDTGSVHDDINGIGGASQILPSWDDWSHLDFKMGNISFLGYTNRIPITTEKIEANVPGELTAEQDLQIQHISDPRVQLSKTVDLASIQPGGIVTYTISMLNIDGQNANDVIITDTLPAGFIYVTGSTNGATTNDPVIDGQNLSWSPFVVPANGGVLTLTFQATVSQIPGTYFNNVGGNSTNGFVVPTGDTAQVEVVASPTACTPSNTYGFSQDGGAKFASLTASNVADFQRLPLFFVPNQGQDDQSVRFQARGLGGNLFFTPGEVVFSLPNPVKVREDDKEKIRYDLYPANVVRIHYQGANDNPEVATLGELPGVVNILKGNDPSKWQTNLPTYSGIAYRELYPGIDLHYEGTDGNLKTTFYVSPGSNPASIVWSYKGADSVTVDDSGNLVIILPPPVKGGVSTSIMEHAPVAWQEVNGNRVMVTVQYVVDKQEKKVSFVFNNGYDPTLPLVIDPTLTYSTYLGGGVTDRGEAVTLDSDCNVYVTGVTYSTNFPTVTPIQTNQPEGDVFVSKLNAAGNTLLYSTYIGGNDSDHPFGISRDSQGRITIIGASESSNYPTPNGYDTSYGGGTCPDGACDDVFVTQLLADGTALRYSTYLGGNKDDEGYGIVLGPDDMIYITGWTQSSTFPTTSNGYDRTFGGGTCSRVPCVDAFVAKINPAATGTSSLLYSTFLGGNSYDEGLSIAVDANAHAYVTGYTRSTGYPTLNAYQPAPAGYSDAFVTKLDTTLSGAASLLYSTFFGGNGTDQAYAIALNGPNQVYLTGSTRSTNFPLTNAFDSTYGGGTCGSSACFDAFITHLDIASNTRVYSSYLGGSNEEESSRITVDENGNAYVTGYTKSTDFTTVAAIQPSKGADSCSAAPCSDAFVAKVNAAGNALTYSTYLGGGAEDYGTAIVVDGLGNAYIVGYTYSSNFPTTPGSFPYVGASTYADVFVVKIHD